MSKRLRFTALLACALFPVFGYAGDDDDKRMENNERYMDFFGMVLLIKPTTLPITAIFSPGRFAIGAGPYWGYNVDLHSSDSNEGFLIKSIDAIRQLACHFFDAKPSEAEKEKIQSIVMSLEYLLKERFEGELGLGSVINESFFWAIERVVNEARSSESVVYLPVIGVLMGLNIDPDTRNELLRQLVRIKQRRPHTYNYEGARYWVDLDVQDSQGSTPLLLAVRALGIFEEDRAGLVESIRILLEAGADPSIANDRGETPLSVLRGLGLDEAMGQAVETLLVTTWPQWAIRRQLNADFENNNNRIKDPEVAALFSDMEEGFDGEFDRGVAYEDSTEDEPTRTVPTATPRPCPTPLPEVINGRNETENNPIIPHVLNMHSAWENDWILLNFGVTGRWNLENEVRGDCHFL